MTTELQQPSLPEYWVDLHTHSTVSDGLLSPVALVQEAARRGIRVLALTDHDTMAGLPAAAGEAQRLGIDFIPGVELSSESDGHDVHILGYFVDPDDTTLACALADLARQRVTRNERIVERLRELGLSLSFDRVRELAGDGTIGRPHIARAMIEAGYVESISEAFERFIGTGRPAFIPRAHSVPEESVALLRNAGALPVLAHPLSAGDIPSILRRLIPAGLLGLEVFYGEYPASTHAELHEIARANGLLVSGGSDFHGSGYRSGRELGSAPVSLEIAIGLRQTWEKMK